MRRSRKSVQNHHTVSSVTRSGKLSEGGIEAASRLALFGRLVQLPLLAFQRAIVIINQNIPDSHSAYWFMPSVSGYWKSWFTFGWQQSSILPWAPARESKQWLAMLLSTCRSEMAKKKKMGCPVLAPKQSQPWSLELTGIPAENLNGSSEAHQSFASADTKAVKIDLRSINNLMIRFTVVVHFFLDESLKMLFIAWMLHRVNLRNSCQRFRAIDVETGPFLR